MKDRERPCSIRPQLRSSQNVLQRSVEPALEVDDARRKVEALGNQDAARMLIDATAATAVKFRKYMLVRTQMSVVTGLLIWALAWITGLQFAAEWGIIAFVLNYIPFIGPLIATLFPTL